MTRTTKKAAAKLNTAIAGAVKRFAPPESLTVDEWADKHRRLSPESSAEAGPWRTKRTPYLEEPMRAFTDPKVHKIVMVAASQVGNEKTSALTQCLCRGFVILLQYLSSRAGEHFTLPFP